MKRRLQPAQTPQKFLLLAAVCFLTGCATSTLDKALAQCAADQGKSSYTRAEGMEKFACL